MKNLLDSQRIEIPCPNCQRKLSETLSKLKSVAKLRCRFCGTDVDVSNSKVRTDIAKAKQALAQFQRTLGRLGK